MPCYFIAQIDVHDPEEYERYLEGTDAVLERHSGRVLAVDESVVVLEGAWPFGRTVVIEFPTTDALRTWYDSPEYRRILSHRKAASRSNAVAVRGRA
jgi:uncharacterized protein (DUF1330 family)